MKFILPTILFLLIMNSCNTKKEKADLIVHNANVYTVDSSFSKAEAFAVKDGKFLAVGKNDDILSKYESDSIVDAGGKAIYPGFFDAHCHFLSYGKTFNDADLTGSQSFKEVVRRIVAHSKKTKSTWIKGRGWDQNLWEQKVFPTKDTLDKLFPKTPILLTRIDGHAAIANQAALDKAGITADTKVNGGEVEIKNGQPTGILLDNAIDLVKNKIPRTTKAEKTEALLRAQKECFAVGLTTVDDAGLSKDEVLLIDELQKAGKLQMRIYAMLDPTEENFSYFATKGPYLTDQLSVRSFKFYADGALGSRGALLTEPYSDSKTKGIQIEKKEYYQKMAKRCYDAGFQMNTHCIGDAANKLMLDVYGEILKGINAKRWRIEHAQIVNPEDVKLFSKYSIIPSVQPTHATSDMRWAEDRVGKKRIDWAYAYLSLLKQNKMIAFGSDFPIEKINPLLGFFAATARQDAKGFPKDGFLPLQKITREDALRAMTIWAAFSNFEEKTKGSIEAGKWADFVMLDKDIMQIDIKEIPATNVLMTVVSGKTLFKK
ncbi:MAG: amidohydrolase [Bacteroidota bacterium]